MGNWKSGFKRDADVYATTNRPDYNYYTKNIKNGNSLNNGGASFGSFGMSRVYTSLSRLVNVFFYKKKVDAFGAESEIHLRYAVFRLPIVHRESET